MTRFNFDAIVERRSERRSRPLDVREPAGTAALA
jgi:hypothetical protein